jgi:hypothetical protein
MAAIPMQNAGASLAATAPGWSIRATPATL